MSEAKYKEVYFGDYCPKCKNKDKKDDEEPCYECLNHPAREDSHKPEKYEKR